MSAIAQGDDIGDREGDSIKIQSFSIKGLVYRDPASTANSEGVRVLVVRDLQNVGAAPAASDLLETVGTGTAPYQHMDFLNGNDLNKRFTVVYDELLSIDEHNPCQLISFQTNHDCHVFFRGAGSTNAAAGNGSYYLVVVSSNGSNTASFDFSSRLRFTDN